jgi:hypothetical protein
MRVFRMRLSAAEEYHLYIEAATFRTNNIGCVQLERVCRGACVVPLNADDPDYSEPPPQYQRRYNDGPLPLPFSIFGR